MGEACDMYKENRYAYRMLVGKPEEKRLLERSRRRWEGITMDLKSLWTTWIELIWLRVETSGVFLRTQLRYIRANAGNFLTS
jgi:hypothetical protein